MKQITGHVKNYLVTVDKPSFTLSVLLIAIAIFVNYYFRINHLVSTFSENRQYVYWYFVFLAAFLFPYALFHLSGRHRPFQNKQFIALSLLAPALFCWKMVYDIELSFPVASLQNIFWNQVIYWPFKLVVLTTALFIIWKLTRSRDDFYGLTIRNFHPRPYLLMLLLMIPLVAAASTQTDFLLMYPKLKNISFLHGETGMGWHSLLYELSYGSDFFTIELFFRGFLVLAFVKWFGKDAILPMACFYCTIHFGKPVAECISSFLGGLVLGVVTFHTRTIFGGLIVHLGIAWMMELGGYLGNRWLWEG